MVLTLIHLLQAQATKVSWLLWAAAILFFLVGLALLIYLMTRAKATDQLDELEDVGGGGLLSREKLLDDPGEKKSTGQDATVAPYAGLSDTEDNADAWHTKPLFSEADFRKRPDKEAADTPLTSSLASVAAQEIPPLPVAEETLAADRKPQPVEGIREPELEAVVEAPVVEKPSPLEFQEERETVSMPVVSPPPVEPTPVIEDRGTQILSSQTAPPVEQNTTPLVAQEEPIYSPQEEALLSRLTQESSSARVDAPASPQRFEPAATFKREPFEPPTIEPLLPKPTATEELSSPTNMAAIAESRDAKTTALSSSPSQKATVLSSPEEVLPEPQIPAPVGSETLPLSAAPTSFTSAPQGQAAPLWETQGAGTRSIKSKPAGSVLGIPAETSHAPLILGQPARAKEDEGVVALLNYDKDLDAAETGRGGAITLVLAILLIAGAVLAYFFVPAVRSRADAFVARVRGQQAAPAPLEKPKAQIYPSRNPEVVKNLVKARGAVTNISEEALEDLSVEVSLDRGEGTAAELRVIAVKPSALAPRQQGLYEFEYEGGKATGFSRYRVTKLLSKNGEVKFTAPNQ